MVMEKKTTVVDIGKIVSYGIFWFSSSLLKPYSSKFWVELYYVKCLTKIKIRHVFFIKLW